MVAFAEDKVSFDFGGDAEGFLEGFLVYIGVEFEIYGRRAGDEFAICRSGCVLGDRERIFALEHHREVLVDDVVGDDGDYLVFGVGVVTADANSVCARGDVAECVHAVVHIVGCACLDGFALGVNQLNVCTVDWSVFVASVHGEVGGIEFFAQVVVVVDDTGDVACDEFVFCVIELHDGFDEEPCFNPVVVIVHQSVCLGTVFVHRAFGEQSHGVEGA